MVTRSIRNMTRAIGIARTFVRHGAGEVLDRLGVPKPVQAIIKLGVGKPKAGVPPKLGLQLSAAAQDLGPSFIKFGQSLSTRPDVVGKEIANDLADLRDRLEQFSGDIAREIIAEQLGRDVEEIFDSFDDQAVAAASIAQVHFAGLADGSHLAVKVLRPGIEEKFARDIDFFLWGAEWMESLYPPMRRLEPIQVVKTFKKSAQTEMDLRLEAAAASELAENFEGDDSFQVPEVDWSRTQRRVLTTDRIGGIPIADKRALADAGRNLEQVARNLILSFLKQAFRDGFFHADLHQGNLFVDDEDNIVAVDFGIMGRLDRRTRLYVAEMLLAFLTGDYRRAAEVHFEAGYVPRDQSVDAFAQACRSIAEPIFDRPPAEVSMAKLFAQLFGITESFNMRTQPQLLLLQKTMVVVEGTCRDLVPETDLWAIAREFLNDWVPENLGPMAKAKEAITEVADAARRLPGLVEKAELAAQALGPEGVFSHRRPDPGDMLGPREGARRMSTNKILYGVIAVLVIVVAVQLF